MAKHEKKKFSTTNHNKRETKSMKFVHNNRTGSRNVWGMHFFQCGEGPMH